MTRGIPDIEAMLGIDINAATAAVQDTLREMDEV